MIYRRDKEGGVALTEKNRELADPQQDESHQMSLNKRLDDLLIEEKTGLRRLFSDLRGDSPYEVRDDLEHIEEVTKRVDAKTNLGEKVIKFMVLNIQADNVIADAKHSIKRDEKNRQIEMKRLDLEELKIEMEIADLKARKDVPKEEKKEVIYDMKDFIDVAERKKRINE